MNDKEKPIYNGPESNLTDRLFVIMKNRGSLQQFAYNFFNPEFARCMAIVEKQLIEEKKV